MIAAPKPGKLRGHKHIDVIALSCYDTQGWVFRQVTAPHCGPLPMIHAIALFSLTAVGVGLISNLLALADGLLPQGCNNVPIRFVASYKAVRCLDACMSS